MTAAYFIRMLDTADPAQLLHIWQKLSVDEREKSARHTFKNNDTLLHAVAARGLVSLVEPLVRAGADVNAYGHDRLTPLHVALKNNNYPLARALLDHGANIDAYGTRGLTMLHQAVLSNQAKAVGWLLDHGADPRLPAYDMTLSDMNAFHMAAGSETGILRLLLRGRGSDVLGDVYQKNNVPMDVLRTVLTEHRLDLLEMLIAHGVNINAQGSDGLTPVQFLVCHRTRMVDGVELLRHLHEAGADIHRTESGSGETLLMLAAGAGWTQAFDYLLAAGVPVDAQRSDGNRLLHIAARGMRHDLFMRVLKLTPQDLNARNNAGQTPLWLAAHHNRRDNVVALLQAGADPTIADIKMRTPDMVCQAPMQHITRRLVMQAQRDWRDSANLRRGNGGRRRQTVVTRRPRGGFNPSKPR